jgi:hypothetical protein
MSLKDWSTTAASNATVGSINWAEGQAPSTVNNSSRAEMADVRTWYEDYEWRDHGHTPTYVSATSFTVTGDKTAVYAANRRLRITDSSTLYGVVVSSSYGSVTTVVVSMDSGSLSASLSAVAVGFSPSSISIPQQAISYADVDAGAAAGPVHDLFRDSASPAASDIVGAVKYSGRDSGAAKQTYAYTYTTILDPTAALEDATWTVQTVVAGTLADRVTVGQGAQIGAPTGGDKGTGTLNAATGVYVAGSSIYTVAQAVEATPYTTASGASAVIPYDNSIPQNTEGNEYLTVSITPKSASNRLVIEAMLDNVAHTVGNVQFILALFQDSTAGALAASATTAPTTGTRAMLRHEMVAGTTSATTFKIRGGLGSSSGTMYLNADSSGTRVFGGISAMRLRVTEYVA